MDKEVVWLLLAQDLIPEKPGEIMQDTAENIIRELISLSMLQEHYIKGYSEIQVSRCYEKSYLVKVDEQDFISKAANSPVHAFIKNNGHSMPSNIKSLLLRSLFASAMNCDDHFGAFSQVCLQTICGLQFILVCDLHGAVENLPDEVGDLVHLKYLRLSSSFKKKLSPPPPHLQELFIRGGLVEIPSWLLSIAILNTLELCHSNLRENPSSVLQFLPKLKHLVLWYAYSANIGVEFCEAGGFPELGTLTIASSELGEWTELGEWGFSMFEASCRKLRFLPEGLQYISTIQELFFTHLHSELERRLNGQENYKIKHISKFSWRKPIS